MISQIQKQIAQIDPTPAQAPTASPLDEALGPIQSQLTAVTQRVLSVLQDPVARSVVYLITAGGKRVRPALVLLTGLTGPSPKPDALIDTAAAAELIHTATLIHDDIIDQSSLRRAQPTFHARWGTERALLMGDYLYATAFTLLAGLNEPYVMRTMADVCRQLCRGELREVESRFRLDLREEEYLGIIGDKTASLIAGCCRAGAFLGGSDESTIARLADFGANFGLAFQIVDDCLDLTGDQAELGKSILTDLDKGALSLPIIYLTQQLAPRERDALFAPLRDHAMDPAFLAQVAHAAEAAGTIAHAQARAREFAQAAQRALGEEANRELGDACQRLADYAVMRRS